MSRDVKLNREPRVTTTIPNVGFRFTGGSTPGGARCRGSELFSLGQPIRVDGINPFLSAFYISPLYLQRLKNIAQTYDHYKFHHVRFDYIPIVPFTKAGTVAMGIDYDVDDSTPTTITDVMVCRGAQMGPVYSKVSCELLGSLSTYNKYFCKDTSFTGVSNPQKFPGSLKVYAEATGPSENIGYMMITYDIEFFSPGSA